MTSIKQNQEDAIQPSIPLNESFTQHIHAKRYIPNFRNMGISLRVCLIVNFVMLFCAIILSNTLSEFANNVIELSASVEPVLLLCVIALYIVQPVLSKLSYSIAIALLLSLIFSITLGAAYIAEHWLIYQGDLNLTRVSLITLMICLLVLYYFDLRHNALTPAIAEARLQALQARIRPHFLFNCINAVISVIRSNPKVAETALEDMADLFRVLMADNRDLVPLASEIALSRQYLALEKLRLEERLQIVWQIDNMPPDALMPPLVLQPLLENAVYHGIEPMPNGGEINIKLFADGKKIHLILTNPNPTQGGHHTGNKMALTNIRERLALHFDHEAQLLHQNKPDYYEVHIVIPYQSNS